VSLEGAPRTSEPSSRLRHQSQDRQRDRPRHPGQRAGARRPGDCV